MTNVKVADCASQQTPLLASPEGNALQIKSYCKRWACRNPACRLRKVEEYLCGDDIRKYIYIGRVPDSEYNNIKQYRKNRAHSGAVMLTITYNVGDRMVASNIQLSPRLELLSKAANDTVFKRLREEMMFGDVKRVTPKPKLAGKGYRLVVSGDAMEQYKVLTDLEYRLTDGEIGAGYYQRGTTDKISQEELINLVRGSLDTAHFEKV